MRMVPLGVLGVLGVLSLSRAVLSTQATTDGDADDVFLEELIAEAMEDCTRPAKKTRRGP